MGGLQMSRLPNQTLYNALKGLIDDTKQKELECRDYLNYVPYLLFKESSIKKIIHKDEEYPCFYGDSDYIISGIVENESCVETTKAYIWELKAPQCPLFKKETKHRLIASEELIKAENQLFHYYHQSKDDSNFHDFFKITHPRNVCLGGIIIGSKKNLIDLPKGEVFDNYKRLYDISIGIREDYIYSPNKMRLCTWDTILDQFATKTLKGKKRIEKELKIQAPLPTEINIKKAS